MKNCMPATKNVKHWIALLTSVENVQVGIKSQFLKKYICLLTEHNSSLLEIIRI